MGTEHNALRFDCCFPGGNICLERMEGDDVYLRQDRRDTEGWWFYWAFRVRGAGGRTLRFHFTDGEPVGTRGAAWSGDGGVTWQWQEGGFDRQSFSFCFPHEHPEVRLAFGMVYTQVHWDRFLAHVGPTPWLKPGILSTSRHGRAVECLQAGCSTMPEYRVLITARHHCCEMMAGYAVEGLVDAILDGSDGSCWLRNRAAFLFVPFMDKDGVEEGDQGKNRRPHDHNRDYAGASIYPEVAALRQMAPAWGDGRLAVAIDLHCPWIRGPHNECAYQVGLQDPVRWAEQQRFGDILECMQSGALDYRCADNLPFGQSWNTSAAGLVQSCSRWAATIPGLRLATSLEIPYATARGRVVDQASARAFGGDLAHAIAAYLQGAP